MSSNGCLVPPSKNPAQEKLWTETWKRIDRFLPELKKELALDDDQPAAEVPPTEGTVDVAKKSEEGAPVPAKEA